MTRQPPAWIARYIGIPFADRGRERATGVDCWGLLHLVFREHYGVTLPDDPGYERATQRDRVAQLIIDHRTNDCWQALDAGAEGEGDVVLLSIAGRPLHIGLVVQPGLMLHILRGIDSCVERYDGAIWRNHEFYRYYDQI